MWLIAEYQPTSLFCLRPANATTSGGKTLLTPTPYAIKMALLDVALRVYGQTQGAAWFPRLRDLEIAVGLPRHLILIKTFVKILRPHKAGPKDTNGTGLIGPMGNTIAYRELIHYGGALRLALRDQGQKGEAPPLAALLPQIHYLGKRGSFMQWVGQTTAAELDGDFTPLNPATAPPFQVDGTLQLLDDCGPKMTFDHANVFSGKNIGVGKENGRLLRPMVLPYRLIRASRGFDFYEHQRAS